MGRKAVFFDIDGTLYNDKVGVPESAVQGLRELKDKGHLAFISTGRARAMIPTKLVDLGFDGVLAACGAYVEYEGNVIYNIDLEKEMADNALRILKQHKVFCILEGQNYLYIDEDEFLDGSEFSITSFKNNFSEKLKPITGIDHYINKITCLMDNHSSFEKAYTFLQEYFDCIRHSPKIVELVQKGFSKAKGIESIINHVGVNIDDTYAFGDSLNDIDMLQYVKYGIAMGNSSAEILKIVKYTTDNIENDGIYNGLKQFNLI